MGAVRWVIWAAVSSLPQAKKVSLDDQIEEAQRHVDRHGGEVVATLRVPGKSRSIVLFEDACDRIEAYAELRALIERRAFDVLIYLDRSRLGRKASLSMAVVELCHDAGIVTYEMESPPADLTLTQSHDDMLIGAIKSVGAQQEIQKLRERHRKGMMGRAKAGKFPNKIPYGYKRVFDADGAERIEVEESEAAQLRLALLDLYVGQGMTQQQVADEMARRGHVYRTGKPWMADHVVTILRAVWPAAGKVVINRVTKTGRPYTITDGQQPAIISVEEAETVLAEQARRRGHRGRPRKPRLFSGVLRCAVCGETLHVHTTRGERAYSCKYNRCRGSRIKEARLIEWMEIVIESLAEQANRDAILASEANVEDSEAIERVNRVNTRIKANEASSGRLLRLYVELGAISEDDFLNQKSRLDAERSRLMAELDDLQAQAGEVEHAANLGDRLDEIARIGLERLHDEERQANLWLRKHFTITVADYDVLQVDYL